MADGKVDLKLDGITGERLVRRGDHTELYQAVQKRFGRKVAVKVYTAEGVRDTAIARFQRECELMGELSSHPHVVTYFESGVKRRRPYVVSEWLDEGTFANRVQTGATMPSWAIMSDRVKASRSDRRVIAPVRPSASSGASNPACRSAVIWA